MFENRGLVSAFLIHIAQDVAPHYPCGPAEAGHDLEVVPGVGWANAIPDGYGEADFMIRGSEHFYFEGRGYHDHVRLIAPQPILRRKTNNLHSN